VWGSTDVPCLIFGHQNLAFHIHPHLTVTVDGVEEPIPSDIGVSADCMSEVHTHDGSGGLHIESTQHGKTFTLLDFFSVWGESMERDGYSYQVFVNGTPVDPSNYVLQDLDSIEVRYSAN
jgi:hypothetical protein